MKKELAKTYDPKGMEDRLYQKWMERHYFHAVADASRPPFTIVIPPPNITGQLHMGHALNNTIQDVIIRFKRMQGFNALWQPGTDHASIATEVRVVEKLKEEGIDKETLGREGFLKRAWEWKAEYGGRIISQLKKLGSSCDWERERFTLDEGCSKAVTEVFCRMHEKGYIYRGSRMVSWCPVCNTSISDAEVEHEEQQSRLWHIKYPLIEADGSLSTTTFLTFATTRPETVLGDTAVAVHPEDERYRHLIGRQVMLPLMDRAIPIVGDTYVDREFGTGVVKITPAHDPNDFEVGKRHGLPEINILNDDATINEAGGQFAGMTREEARKAIVRELEARGLLGRVEDYSHNVGIHDRCKTTVEPMIKQQWFVKMEELIKPAAAAVKKGEIKLIPERMDKLYFNWTDNIRDWCISRQLWWGHRIPAWYCEKCGEITVSRVAVGKCPKCGHDCLTQDPDTLDTWFSSALWPFSTLGWPEPTEDLKYFYPTNVLVTAYDIIFFWVIRMVFSGYEQMEKKPFDTVLLHGLIRDAQGRKMSKSLGNGIDPLEIIENYGADALRFTLITGNAPGSDMRFYYEKVEASRNFANKIWNASRFIMMNRDEDDDTAGATGIAAPFALEAADKWILAKLNRLIGEVTGQLESYELGIAVQKVYDFVWDEFCDWYIEMVKPRLYRRDASDKNSGESAVKEKGDSGVMIDPEAAQASRQAALWTLTTVLTNALKLLHPYIPFITEEIFCTLQSAEESIMVSAWPERRADWDFAAEEKEVEIIKEAVRGIRNLRAEMNVPPRRQTAVFVVSENTDVLAAFQKSKHFFATLAGAAEVTLQTDKSGIGTDALSVVIGGATLYIPLAELVDLTKEIERLQKEAERLDGELSRVADILSNERFIAKAPAAKIAAETEKQEKYHQMKEQVKIRLQQLTNLGTMELR